jgi:hypothetical protein
VLPKYVARQSTNLVGQALKPLEIVNRSKWLTLYPDPWDPARLSLVKKSSDTNYWYAFLYDMFLDGKLSRWGDGSSNVLPFLVKSEILKLIGTSHDLQVCVRMRALFVEDTFGERSPAGASLCHQKKSTSRPEIAPFFVFALFVQMRKSTLHRPGKHF